MKGEHVVGQNRMIERLLLPVVAKYLRSSPFQKGRWRLLRWALQEVRSLPPEQAEVQIRTRHDFKLQVDLADWLGQFIYVAGEYEPPTTKAFTAILSPGSVVIDVGANIGYFTILSSRCVGSGGLVHAFEPIPLLRERLEHNVALNGLKNIQIWPVAVADHKGTANLYLGPKTHLGTSSLRPVGKGDHTVKVSVGSLDSLLVGLPRLDLLKIDIEGAELLALEGARGLLERFSPAVIVEVTPRFLAAFDSSVEELFILMASFGYRAFRIDETELVPVGGGDFDNNGQSNVLFAVDRKTVELVHTALVINR